MFRSKALLSALFIGSLAVGTAAGGCSDGGPVPTGDAGTGGAGGAIVPDGGAGGQPDAGARGLMVVLRGVDGLPKEQLPVTTSEGASIERAALWLKRVEIAGDQGSSSDTQRLSLGLDVGPDVALLFPDAAPGLYSLARVDIGPVDLGATSLPNGFDGQALSARVTGHLASGRTFDISAAQTGSVDLRPAAPADLLPGMQLQVTIEIDVSTWLHGISFDSGNSSEPFVAGPEDHGGVVDAFNANVLASLRVKL